MHEIRKPYRALFQKKSRTTFYDSKNTAKKGISDPVCHKHKNMPLNSVFFRNMIFVFLCIQNMCGKQNNTYIFNSIYILT